MIEKQFNYRATTLELNHNFNTHVSNLKTRKKRAYNATDPSVLEYCKSKNLPTKTNVK